MVVRSTAALSLTAAVRAEEAGVAALHALIVMTARRMATGCRFILLISRARGRGTDAADLEARLKRSIRYAGGQGENLRCPCCHVESQPEARRYGCSVSRRLEHRDELAVRQRGRRTCEPFEMTDERVASASQLMAAGESRELVSAAVPSHTQMRRDPVSQTRARTEG